MYTEHRPKRNFVANYVLGIADDIPSTNRMLVLSRITHWVCFLIAVVAALKFAQVYFNNGNLWVAPPEEVSDRQLLQIVFNQGMWLFMAGVALVAGFIAWLNTDVHLNRKIAMEQRGAWETIVTEPTTTLPAPPSAVIPKATPNV